MQNVVGAASREGADGADGADGAGGGASVHRCIGASVHRCIGASVHQPFPALPFPSRWGEWGSEPYQCYNQYPRAPVVGSWTGVHTFTDLRLKRFSSCAGIPSTYLACVCSALSGER